MTAATYAETYQKWLDCNGTRVPVPDAPKFQEEGIEVYPSASDELVFVEQGEPTFCAMVGYGWKIDGFVYGARSVDLDKNILLFKVSGEEIERYFDIRRKKEVYRLPEHKEKLVVSDTVPEKPGKGIEVLQEWQGAESKISQTEYKLVTSHDEWEELWKRHDKQGKMLPKVDFTKHMVIAILLGNIVNTSGVQVVDVREIDNVIQFRFHAMRYQTGNWFDKTTPFGIFVIPHSKKKIKVEQDVQGLIGGPPKWRVQAEFN